MSLTLSEFVTMLVASSLLLVSVASLASRYLHVRAEKRLVHIRAVCRICGCSFIADNNVDYFYCFACNKPNLRRRNGRLG